MDAKTQIMNLMGSEITGWLAVKARLIGMQLFETGYGGERNFNNSEETTMQQISEILKSQKPRYSGTNALQERSQEPSLRGYTPISPKRIDQFFLEMAAIYPYRWAAQFNDVSSLRIAKNQWYQALREMTEEDIQRGLYVIRKRGGEFPPSIPEFIKIITPAIHEFGILSNDSAYQAYCDKDYSDPLVSKTEMALRRFGYELSQMWAKEHKKFFIRHYEIVVSDHARDHIPSRYQILPRISAGKDKTLGVETSIGTTNESDRLESKEISV